MKKPSCIPEDINLSPAEANEETELGVLAEQARKYGPAYMHLRAAQFDLWATRRNIERAKELAAQEKDKAS